METNLAYAGSGTNTYNDATAPITEGQTAADFTYTAARYYIPPGSNRTTGTTDPSTSTNGGTTGAQHGYLYNWCAAMNSQSSACQNTTDTQPNQSANGGTPNTLYNICPAGWRLPTGDPNTGEFTLLDIAINGGSTTNDLGLRTNSLFMYSGGWYSGTFGGQGGSGYYLSSTVSSASVIRLFYFNINAAEPTRQSYKYNAQAIRCVAP